MSDIITANLTTQQAAAYLALCEDTMNTWRSRGVGPNYIKLGRAVRYRRQDLDAWMSANVRTSTSQTAAA